MNKEKFTPQQQGDLEDSRSLETARLVKGGAHHIVDEEDGSKRLNVTDKQIKDSQMEHEGTWFKDAEAFVRANKEIAIPSSEVPENLQKKPGKGWLTKSDRLFFVDSEGNLAVVKLSEYDDNHVRQWSAYQRIESFRDILASHGSVVDAFKRELSGKGFKISSENIHLDSDYPAGSIRKYMDKVNAAEAEKKKFDF